MLIAYWWVAVLCVASKVKPAFICGFAFVVALVLVSVFASYCGGGTVFYCNAVVR